MKSRNQQTTLGVVLGSIARLQAGVSKGRGFLETTGLSAGEPSAPRFTDSARGAIRGDVQGAARELSASTAARCPAESVRIGQ